MDVARRHDLADLRLHVVVVLVRVQERVEVLDREAALLQRVLGLALLHARVDLGWLVFLRFEIVEVVWYCVVFILRCVLGRWNLEPF